MEYTVVLTNNQKANLHKCKEELQKQHAGIVGMMYKEGVLSVTGESLPNESEISTFFGSFSPEADKVYTPKRFLASCMIDVTMQTILEKLDAKQEGRLSFCLQNGNFEMLNALIMSFFTQDIIAQNDVDYFGSKIFSEENVNLAEYSA